MTTAAIEVDDVTKAFRLPHHRRTTLKEYFLHPFQRNTFEYQLALDGLSLSVESGEFFAIIGPNGSGKSTLLKILAGIYRQDRGRVRINGKLSPFIELGVGFHPDLTAKDNIMINGTLLGLGKRELGRRFDQIVEFAELERFVDQKLKNYSSGMQVRLAYSIAIQVDFDILLLDEVLAVGDQSFQEKCLATFEDFRRAKKTIVLVSHDLDTVENSADRALLLQEGQTVLVGEPAEVVSRYRHEHERVLAGGA